MKCMKNLASAALWVVAGACTYLFFLNRSLIQLRDRRFKSFLIRGGGLLALAVSGLTGWLLGWARWKELPLAVLSITAIGEARRLIHRWRHRATPPMSESGRTARRPTLITTTDLVLRRYEVTASGWNGPRLRVAHLSDFHLNSHLPIAYYVRVMRQVAAEGPDLVLFTGDFITYSKYIPLIKSVLPLAAGRYGSFGIIGNHDYWAGAAQVREAAQAAGVTMLDGAPVRVTLENGHAVLLHGFEHPWPKGEGKQAPAPAKGSSSGPRDLSLILTHTPDNIYRLRKWGCDAIFAGHYHGGQMRLPLIGPLVVPSKYGRRYDRGHFQFGNTHLFVTAGVDSAEPPVRLWCPPDVLIVDFLPQAGGAWSPYAS